MLMIRVDAHDGVDGRLGCSIGTQIVRSKGVSFDANLKAPVSRRSHGRYVNIRKKQGIHVGDDVSGPLPLGAEFDLDWECG
ncbi:hypothetical protein BHE74_00033552 [Ensete ventricosum]|nr:hypothetical protein BHE74_00033552 [Ensete ventricosum]